LGPTWCEAVAKGAKLRRARNDLDFHVHHMASIWNPSGSLWAQLHLNMTNLRQQSGSRQRNLRPRLGQVGSRTTGAIFADSMRHAENLRFAAVSKVFWL